MTITDHRLDTCYLRLAATTRYFCIVGPTTIESSIAGCFSFLPTSNGRRPQCAVRQQRVVSQDTGDVEKSLVLGCTTFHISHTSTSDIVILSGSIPPPSIDGSRKKRSTLVKTVTLDLLPPSGALSRTARCACRRDNTVDKFRRLSVLREFSTRPATFANVPKIFHGFPG